MHRLDQIWQAFTMIPLDNQPLSFQPHPTSNIIQHPFTPKIASQIRCTARLGRSISCLFSFLSPITRNVVDVCSYSRGKLTFLFTFLITYVYLLT